MLIGGSTVCRTASTSGRLQAASTLAAACSGQMRILEYALDLGLPMNETAPEAAATCDHPDALRLLIARGCPYLADELRADAQRFRLHRILELLDELE